MVLSLTAFFDLRFSRILCISRLRCYLELHSDMKGTEYSLDMAMGGVSLLPKQLIRTLPGFGWCRHAVLSTPSSPSIVVLVRLDDELHGLSRK